jgi:hypothetical protein
MKLSKPLVIIKVRKMDFKDKNNGIQKLNNWQKESHLKNFEITAHYYDFFLKKIKMISIT